MTTGLNMQSILDEVRENLAKLATCRRHKFTRTSISQRRLMCAHCGGELDAIAAQHYRDGYVAAGGVSKDVYDASYLVGTSHG